CIVNTGIVPEKILEKYKEEDAYQVVLDEDKIGDLGCKVIKGNIINIRDLVRHDPYKLAKIATDLLATAKRNL
ncbi:MAG: hypothetical protein JW994_03510, partial [Candidatus Omnitrophica bacterium]|nr:hypothetical protein [Candidatus Omnitrophota bacterium]